MVADQTGKTVIVTGSNTGIGFHMARVLAKRGASVTMACRSLEKGDASRKRILGVCPDADVSVAVLDLADLSSIADFSDAYSGRSGKLDVLINNAGITSSAPFKDLDAIDLDEWDRVLAVNVRGIVQVTRAATSLLRAAPAGAIVNTASIVGLRPGPQPLAYSTSKAAVVSLTKTLALALGPDIRVNAVAPGWMEGDWMERMLGDNYDRLMERRAKMTPLKRCVTAEDVAETMVSLALRNRFVTGEIVVIDGGFANST